MMRVLNFTAELEVHNQHGHVGCGETWCVIKLSGYEIGRVEVIPFHSADENEMLETAAAVWLADRLKT